MKSEVLILASPDDVHYRAIDWALRSVGVETRLLFGNAFPVEECQSLFIDDDRTAYEVHDVRGDRFDLLTPPVVWYRRSHWPVISEDLPEIDQRAALREAEMFVDGVRTLSAASQRWINDPDREAVANRKPYQLHLAKACGLAIPRTLMTNNPSEVWSFIEQYGPEVIFKPFHSIKWSAGEDHSVLFAQKIGLADIGDGSALQLTSHIFQQYVDKAYELRVLCMGEDLHAFKLDTQAHAETTVDWRISTDGSLTPESYDVLPSSVQDGIRSYMRLSGLAFGAFDFIVTRTGDYVFLECNVSGQFLFLDEWNPDLHIMSAFLQFLTQSLPLTTSQRSEIDRLRYGDFYHSLDVKRHYADLVQRYRTPTTSRNIYHEPVQA